MATILSYILILVFAYSVAPQKGCFKPDLKFTGAVKDPRQSYPDGSHISVMCFRGYSGSANYTCRGKRWIPKMPKCHLIKCPVLQINNGQSSIRTHRFDTNVTITCNADFRLIGAQLIRCAENGSWTPEVPTCQPAIICSTPAVNYGVIKDGEMLRYKPQDTVTIGCKEGFDLIGSSQITCGRDGQWQGLPECRVREVSGRCGPPPTYELSHLRDGYDDKREYKSGDMIRYKCTIGYRRLMGRDTSFCSNGRWTNLEMKCEPKRCGPAGEILNGRYEYSGVSFGDSATVLCNEGYERIGPAMRHCRDGGWDERDAVCEPVHCPPPAVTNAKTYDNTDDYIPFGQVVSYHCRTGTLIGSREIYCTKNSNWSAPPPKCKDVLCPNPLIRSGSKVMGYRAVYSFGNTVKITCNPGYKLVVGNDITCGEDGKWKPDPSKMCVIANKYGYN